MIQPGPRNLISDVDGIRVGNAADERARTGVTVVLVDEPAVAAVDVRGGAPGTRETDALHPASLVEHVDALVLSGGTVFGLDAGAGAALWLAARQKGFPLGDIRVPVVPAAVLFDLTNGGDKEWGDNPPYRALAMQACDAAAAEFALGNAGAGLGAVAGALKGGLGSASAVFDDGVQVGAVIAVNAVGSAVIPGTETLWAWAAECDGEFGAAGGLPRAMPDRSVNAMKTAPQLGRNTTIGVVATNTHLSRAQLGRVAIMAHDGIARAVRPAHTPFDGDTLFAVATGRREIDGAVDVARIGAQTAECVERAIGRAVYAAGPVGDIPALRSSPENNR
jgi:L-aminopeptidase/D-esterase-like protein